MKDNIYEKINKHPKKNYRYNDSISKYKRENPKLIKKKKLQIDTNVESLPFHNLKNTFNEFSNNFTEKQNVLNYIPIKKLEITNKLNIRTSRSVPKKGFLRKSIRTQNYNNLRNYNNLNTPENTSFLNTSNDFSDLTMTYNYRNRNDPLYNQIEGFSTRTSYKPNSNKTKFNMNNGYISDISKTTNNEKYFINILSKDNQKLRQRNREINLLLKDNLKKQETLKMNYQNLYNDKQMLLMKAKHLQNELNNYKNMSLNQIEIRNNKIRELNEKMMKMKTMIDVKKNQFYNLSNDNKHYISKIIQPNKNVYENQNVKNETPKSEYNIESKNNNNLANQINNLLLEKQKILLEKKNNETLLNQKINKLIQINKKYYNTIENLKKEQQNPNIISNHFQKNMKELNEKISILQNENNLLKEKLSITDNNLEQLIKERNNLIQENIVLKNKQTSLSMKLSTSYKDFTEENNILKNKLNDKEKELESYRNQITNINALNNDQFSQGNIDLKKKIIELEKINKSLLKEKENIYSNNQLENNESKRDGEKELGFEGQKLNIKFKNEIEEKNKKIEQLEKANLINKNNSNKLLLENNELKEKIQLIQNSQDEGLIYTIDNLKEELKDKNKSILKLIEENKNMRNTMNDKNINYISNFNSNNEGDEKEIDLNNNNNINEYNPFRITMNSQGLNDVDKIKLYKERIKDFQIINESDKKQIQTLKEDIKIMQSRIKYLETFGGQIQGTNEFIYLLNQVLINCKPQRKEEKDALEKIINVLNNFQS